MDYKDFESKSNILDLYEQYIDDLYENGTDDKKATSEEREIMHKFFASFSEEQSKLYEKLEEHQILSNEALQKKIFVYAFSLAVKLVVQGLK